MIAMATWVGALSGPVLPLVAAAAVVVTGLILSSGVRSRVGVLIACIGIGACSGALAAERTEVALSTELPPGRGTVIGVASSDASPMGDTYRFVLRPQQWSQNDLTRPWSGPPIVVMTDSDSVVAGDTVAVTGRIRDTPTSVRGKPMAGRIVASQLDVLAASSSWAFGAGNAIRDRVHESLSDVGPGPESALLAGFLIGDTSDLPAADSDALRKAGLTHFVAVSGSNVALVLGAWWLVLGPMGAGSRFRAVTGLAVLAVFIVATRWESSVIRAATMAGIAMCGRALGMSIDAWGALGGAITVLLAFSGQLAFDVGFQLSALATAGVLLGMRFWADRRPRLFWGLLAASVSAQVAVVPLLLLHFGSVPLLAPLANLIAAPLVTVATALAGIAVIVGLDAPLYLAQIAAGLVLEVASTAASWPQLDWLSVFGLGSLVAASWTTAFRPIVLAGIGAVAALSMIPPGPPSVPTVVFLDVGQGDSVVVRDPAGGVVLMDGGRDPTVLREALRRHGIGRVDLLIASHGDADHAGGLVGLVDDIAIGRIWVPRHAELGEILDGVVVRATDQGVPVDAVGAGDSATLGSVLFDVLGPDRRYASDNDGSVVLMVTVGSRSVLLPGDIGTVAQNDLPELSPDILMVPHHGAATTDPQWLAETAGPLAVISVGPNSYGHPAPEIVAVLESVGTRVLTTWDLGDVVIPLS